MTTDTQLLDLQNLALDKDILRQIETLQLSEQTKRLRQRYFEEPVRVATERPRILMGAWQESEGMPVEARWAHLFQRLLEHNPVTIFDDELTAGIETKFFRGVYPRVETDPTVISDHLKEQKEKGSISLLSPAHRTGLSDEDCKVLEETTRYFTGKTGAELVRQLRAPILGTWWEDFLEARGTTTSYDNGNAASGIPVFEKVLTKGLRGTIQEAEAGLARFGAREEDDPEKLIFWQAVTTCCQAVIALAHRYAALADAMAAQAADPVRKAQLERIAAACRRVPEHPAKSFFEALQSIRLVYLGAKLEGAYAASMGRVDQYLYPYFIADVKSGRLSLDEAVDLLADLYSYLARQQHTTGGQGAENHQASSAIVNITVGGVTREGQDACNELTWLLMHVAGLLKYAQPQLTLRLNPITPRPIVLKALQTNYRVGGGVPQFHSDEQMIAYIAARGVPIEEARDWAAFGCSQPFPVNVYSSNIKEAAWPNVPLALDLALHNGIAPRTGKRLGPETGDPRAFQSFDEMYGAFKTQLEFMLRRLAWHCRFAIHAWGQRQRYPFFSTLLPGCVEKGKDMLLGGQKAHPLWYMKDRGIVNAADSLTALKKLVYEDKKLTMAELLEATNGNFAGPRGEGIRRMCLAAPKYGNEDAEADGMVREVAAFSGSIIMSEKNLFGEPYAINRNGVGWHYYGGKGVGALPDGRKMEEPLADGSASPMRGLDRNGPTAVLNSALAADFRQQSAVAILNMRFPRTLVQSEESIDKLAALTETFVAQGGSHVQYNMIDHKVLLEAKKHPEQFKDLVVRVAGYSAYFVDLSPEVQDEIIRRTEHEL